MCVLLSFQCRTTRQSVQLYAHTQSAKINDLMQSFIAVGCRAYTARLKHYLLLLIDTVSIGTQNNNKPFVRTSLFF